MGDVAHASMHAYVYVCVIIEFGIGRSGCGDGG
jgi:hypothetical protein